MLKILLFTKTLKGGIDLFSKSLPPYIPQEEIAHDTIEIGDDYFGCTEGSKELRFSLCGFSDFHRYILGFNSNSESQIYTLMPHDQNGRPSMLPLVLLQSMIAQKSRHWVGVINWVNWIMGCILQEDMITNTRE